MRQQSAHSQAANAALPVSGRLLQRKCACGKNTAGGGDCRACERDSRRLQRKPADRHQDANNHHDADAVPDSIHEVLRSSGCPLDAPTRSFFESRFGQDFSRVKVHTDARAQESAREVGALAYTVGRDVVFAAGQYAPGTSTYRGLLAHELTHVMQQRGEWDGSPLMIGEADDSYERAADAAARNVVLGRVVSPPVQGAAASPSRVQRLLSRDEAVAESEDEGAGAASDGVVLTAEEAVLLEEVLSNEPELAAAAGKDGDGQGGASDGEKKPKTAKRRGQIRKGHFVGGWLVRLLCGHSGRYFRHFDILSCLRLRRRHKQEREPRARTEPEEERVPPPPEPRHRQEREPGERAEPEEQRVPTPADPASTPTPSVNVTATPPPAQTNVPTQTATPVPVPTFGGRRIPPGGSITLQFSIAFNQSSDVLANPNAATATLAALANFLRQNPNLRVNIAGNVYNDSSGIIQGGGANAINQTGFWLNGQATTAGGVMLARARRIRSALVKDLNVPNTVWVRTGRVMGPQGLMVNITITNPGP